MSNRNRAAPRTVALLCVLAIWCLLSPPATADEDPPVGWTARVNNRDGTVGVGADGRIGVRPVAEGARGPRLVTEQYLVPACELGGDGGIAATASCGPVPCLTATGREGRVHDRRARLVERSTGDPRGPWSYRNFVCIADPDAPKAGLRSRILREFEDLKLPGSTVRTRPADWTLVNLPTEFFVEPPTRNFELGTILGRKVTVSITPVAYLWSFGDGTDAVTAGDGRRARGESVGHIYTRSGTVEPSVATTYRARYRVDGGRSRGIPGRVTVEGPVTALDVFEARSQLIAGDR